MHPALLTAVIAIIAFGAGLFAGGAVVYRTFEKLSEISIPLLFSTRLQLALTVLRLHRSGQDDQAVEYLELQVDMGLKQFVQRLREYPDALEEEQFRRLLGRVVEYRAAHPSTEPAPHTAPECQLENGETAQLWPSLHEALNFACRHGMIDLAGP